MRPSQMGCMYRRAVLPWVEVATIRIVVDRRRIRNCGKGTGHLSSVKVAPRLLALTFARDSPSVYQPTFQTVMKRYASFLSAALCSMTLVSSASAHVRLVYPQGGETFPSGSRVTIEWQLLISHSQQDWDLYFSSDGGVTWDTLALDLSISLRSYDWTVPEIETTQAKIKVVQDNSGLDYESTCELPESVHLVDVDRVRSTARRKGMPGSL